MQTGKVKPPYKVNSVFPIPDSTLEVKALIDISDKEIVNLITQYNDILCKPGSSFAGHCSRIVVNSMREETQKILFYLDVLDSRADALSKDSCDGK